MPVDFICARCGRTHEALSEDALASASPEEIARLRVEWIAADDKLSASPKNEHYERAYTKAWFAYAIHLYPRAPMRPPETITTKSGPDGYFFVCVECSDGASVAGDAAGVVAGAAL